MLQLLQSGRPSFNSVPYSRLLLRCMSSQSSYFTSASAKTHNESTFADPALSFDEPQILSAMPPADHAVWRKRHPFPQLDPGMESQIADPYSIPKPMWEEPVSETNDYWKKKREQQLRLEQNFVYEYLEKYKKFVEDARAREQAATLPTVRLMLLRWMDPLMEAISEEQSKILKGQRVHRAAHEYLVLLEPDELALLTIHTVLGIMVRGGDRQEHGSEMPFVEVAAQLGRAVQAQLNLLKLRHRVSCDNRRRVQLNKYIEGLKNGEVHSPEDDPEDLSEWEKKIIKRSTKMETRFQLMLNKWKKNVQMKDVLQSKWSLGKEQVTWDEATSVQVGALLVDLFKKSAVLRIDKATGKVMGQQATSICANEPVLKHEVVWKRPSKTPKKLGILTIHPAVIGMVESTEAHTYLVLTKGYPMVYPPMPWRGVDVGAYLSTPSRAIRAFDNTEPVILMRQADATGQLDRIYQALTILGHTPWIMNRDVLAVVEEVWNAGGGKLGLPSRENAPVPVDVSSSFKAYGAGGAFYACFAGDTEQEEYFRKAEIRRARKKNAELHSLRCDVELKLGVARKFLEEEQLYFPHNIDFRGRAYPIPPHLNHIGNDMCRGLLLFADAKPLGKHGLDWLYIQIANLYGAGENKKPLTERLQFGMKNLDRIFDSADNPVSGMQWWMNADSPWQLLATCIEIRNALNSGNPETFPSRMHIHQHYAALGRDALGAKAVNLGHSDGPNDVYSEISQVVARIVAEDAEKGSRTAKILKGHVDRKLIKQTVMTSVYGVTFIGAREQIANRLKERGWEDDDTLFAVSSYAAKVTMAGLHEMFQNAKNVMHWLATCARKVAHSGNTVTWTTPLGLPVGQPYRSRDKQAVRTVLQEISLVRHRRDMPIMKRRQCTAFPPNYIHSLDSTHMMMTALACHDQKITFAGVHDSFWTHAATVDDMNRVLREQFYDLHSQPLLEQLRQQFEESHQGQVPAFPPVPDVGDFDLKEIFDAPYFFN